MDLHSSAEPIRHLGTSLPIDWREGPPTRAATFLAVFGATCMSSVLILFGAFATEGPIPDRLTELAIAALLFVVGLLLFLVGINWRSHRTLIRIDTSSVRFKEVGLIWGAADWTEPLSAYRGVLTSQQYRSGGRNRSSYTEYMIHLKYARDPDRDIELYRSRNGNTHRPEAEDFARLLGLPVLAERGDGSFAVRDVADLDKSVRERAAEGGLEVPASGRIAVHRDSALEITRMPEGYAFEASLRRGVCLTSIAVVVGVGMLYLYFGPGLLGGDGSGWLGRVLGVQWIVPLVGVQFVLVGLGLSYRLLTHVERLEVSQRGVRIGAVRPGSALEHSDRASLTADEIEEVGLRKDKYRRFRLAVIGDRQTLRWGQFLSKSQLALVRDAVLETLTR